MLTDSQTRRDLLRQATAAATTLWLPRAARSQPRWQDDPFALGVASGSPRHDGVVLWTRLAPPDGVPDEPVTVYWELADDEGFRRIRRQGQVLALPALAHSVHVELQGLAPARTYHYRFRCGEAVSPAGRTRTLPAPDAPPGRLRLAYASCQRWEHGYYAAWRHLRDEHPDLVLFLGDYIYEYPGAARAVRVPTGGWTVTLDDYRQRYALHHSDPDLQAMHAACPWVVTWDDHEVQNDYAGRVPGDSGPTVQDFGARRAAAYQAFYEHLPVRASVLTQALEGLARGAEVRLYGQVPCGRLATLHLLDDRQYRDAQVCNRDGRRGSGLVDPVQCPDWTDPARSLLGAAQEAWFESTLARGGEAVWTLIGQQTLFGARDFQPGSGQRLWNDGWDGYPAARRRLTDALLRHRPANPVLLGGDVHENWVGHVKADYGRPDSPAIGVEFCGTSITSRGGPPERVADVLAENPHFVFADARHRGYGLVDLTPDRLETTLRVIDDPTRRDAAVATLARFSVAAGRPVIEAA